MSISKEEVVHIEKLAKLRFNEQELDKFTNDLSNIVDFANKLKEVDVNGVEPTAHILDIKNVFRKDEVIPSFDREKILRNAPTKDGGCVTVPKVVE